MPLKYLDKLFRPGSVAVIGASTRVGAVGHLVMRNLLEGRFGGPIMPVNPKHTSVAGVLAYGTVDDLPLVPDMAVVCTPPAVVPEVIEALGRKGCRSAVVLTAGLATPLNGSGTAPGEQLRAAAERYGIRILGPNCLGLLVPDLGLNASFAHVPALPGNIAFASQSGAMCTAVLDWARGHGIGFSHFISMGEALNLDFGDVLDYLGGDPGTRAILLYIESIRERRNFMSAARAAARNKPVLVIKAGRNEAGAKAANSHTGALAGSDQVYDAAFRRAGMLRVDSIGEIFAAVETLARAPRLTGERLAIMTNGGGIGVLAIDRLCELNGQVAELSADTLKALDDVLPPTWSRGNPVDIIGDANAERYEKALRILVKAPEVDAILVMHAPTATASSLDAAHAVIGVTRDTRAPIITSWVGEEAVAAARHAFQEAGIPTFETPNHAVGGFMHVIEHRRNQTLLMETPPSAPPGTDPATPAARLVVENRLTNGHDMMSEPEAKAVLSAYGIPTVETHIVRTPQEAADKAASMGFPVALKILSQDITHKSDVGGVQLFLESKDAVSAAADNMLAQVQKKCPDAKIDGFTVQRMALRPGAHELIIGVTCDPIFGPVILFGQGGTAVEIIADRAVALPPLNMLLAKELIGRTRISKLLAGYRDRAPVDMDALCAVLIKVSQLLIDIPEIRELDINPLLADEHGVLALDARIRVAPPGMDGCRELAIHPYPRDLEEIVELGTGEDREKILLRPIRPEDEPQHRQLLDALSPEDARFRFFGTIRDLPHSEMARFTQIDYDREMAFIAERQTAPDGGGNGAGETLGVVRGHLNADRRTCEFAILVRSDMKGKGLGRLLMGKLMRYAKSRGVKTIEGEVMSENSRMLEFCKGLGFESRSIPLESVNAVTLSLS